VVPGCQLLPLWAVHIGEGLLTPLWLGGGFLLAGALALVAAWRVREDDVARIGLMTAAFFVVSALPIALGPTSVHLLLNSLVGVVLGWQAALAIPVALFLQAALLQHGGFLVLGVNSCVMVLPALLAGQLFAALRRVPWVRQAWFGAGLVMISGLVWTLSLVYCVTLLLTNPPADWKYPDYSDANALTFHPLLLLAALAVSLLAAWYEHRMGNAPEFPVGLLVGEAAVLATVFLHCVAIVWGGPEPDLLAVALVSFTCHLPIAVFEGVVLGFIVGFLARVKPEMLGWEGPAAPPAGETRAGPTHANGTPAGSMAPERITCSADRSP
jgi:cobalt/nickel transport system permease protein